MSREIKESKPNNADIIHARRVGILSGAWSVLFCRKCYRDEYALLRCWSSIHIPSRNVIRIKVQDNTWAFRIWTFPRDSSAAPVAGDSAIARSHADLLAIISFLGRKHEHLFMYKDVHRYM